MPRRRRITGRHDGAVNLRRAPAARPGPWSRPAYRRFFAARTVSQAGDVVQFTSLSLLIFRLTGSGIGLSGLMLAEILPLILLAPVAGSIVDRRSRVQVMVAADAVRCTLVVILAIWHSSVSVIYPVAFGLSAASAFFNPAAGALLPALVDRDQLVSANARVWSAAVLSQVALAPAVGLLAGAVGFAPAFAVNAASFAISALLLFGLPESWPTRSSGRQVGIGARGPLSTLWTKGREGFQAVLANPLLRALAVGQGLAALSAGATSALLVVLAGRWLHAAGGGYGALLGAIAAGALVGPLLLRSTSRGRRGRSGGPGLIFAAFGLRGAVDVTLASVASLPVALIARVGYGMATSVGNVSFPSLLQSRVPDAVRGRVFAAFDLLWQSMRLASLILGGVAADRFGIRTVYYAGGGLLLLAALSGLLAGRSFGSHEP